MSSSCRNIPFFTEKQVQLTNSSIFLISEPQKKTFSRVPFYIKNKKRRVQHPFLTNKHTHLGKFEYNNHFCFHF